MSEMSSLENLVKHMTWTDDPGPTWFRAWYEGKDWYTGKDWPAELDDNPYPAGTPEHDAWRKGLEMEHWTEMRRSGG